MAFERAGVPLLHTHLMSGDGLQGCADCVAWRPLSAGIAHLVCGLNSAAVCNARTCRERGGQRFPGCRGLTAAPRLQARYYGVGL